MPEFRTTRRLPHSAENMFALVADVERYPEFVPFCEGLVVRRRQQDGDREVLVADMAVGYKLIRERFTSSVTLDRRLLQIRADYLEGPFRAMDNSWTFKALSPDASEVSFAIRYEFRSRALALLVGAMFDRVFRAFADAFAARAEQVYGRRSALSEINSRTS
jgi:coenzyme Q-binding protein COQ10